MYFVSYNYNVAPRNFKLCCAMQSFLEGL